MIRDARLYLKTHLLYVVLTDLSIALAISCVLTVRALSGGFRHELMDEFDKLGMAKGTISLADPERMPIDWIENLEKAGIFQCASAYTSSIINWQDQQIAVYQTDPQYARTADLNLSRGHFFTGYEQERVIVLGACVDQMNGGQDIFRLNDHNYHVIGVLSENNEGMEGNRDWSAYMPTDKNCAMCLYQLDEQCVTGMIQAYLDVYLDENEYVISSPDVMSQALDDLLDMLETIMTVIAGVSIMVALAGLMSITWITADIRTAEWGIRKAAGAGWREILIQIMYESGIMAAIGVGAGLLVSGITGFILSRILGITLPFDGRLALKTAVITILSGAAAGILPAMRALEKSPAECLSHSEGNVL